MEYNREYKTSFAYAGLFCTTLRTAFIRSLQALRRARGYLARGFYVEPEAKAHTGSWRSRNTISITTAATTYNMVLVLYSEPTTD